jgi:hypothetical protein
LSRDPQNPEHALTAAELDQLAVRDPTDVEATAAWLQHLEAFGVYFSAPLDLDFLMLQAFPEAYQGTAPVNGGPQIPAEGVALQQRVQQACRATLKGDGGNGDTYTDGEKLAFIWYSYLFLGRGKPSTHILALNELDGEALVAGTPGVLTRLIDVAQQKLSPPAVAHAADGVAVAPN